MIVHNTDIADIFDEIADFLEIDGQNPFRIRAYRNAARTIRGLGSELKEMAERNQDLTRLPAIGKDLAAKILEILGTGTSAALKKLQERIPPEVRQILKIPNLGPKRVGLLYRELNIENTEQLLQVAREGLIQSLPGFGEKIETHIIEAIKTHVETKKRFKLGDVKPHVESLLEYLNEAAGAIKVVVAGSFRRSRETVGDLDVLVTARKKTTLMEHFIAYDEVVEVLSKGATRSSVILRSGLQVDLRIVEPENFGAALQYFTGSQAHNIAIRRLGRQRGLKINEYGVFKFEKQVAGKTEESVYRSIGLSYIPPELRENRGEIEASREKRLPELLDFDDLKGDLHVHTNSSDGRNTIIEMAQAAKRYGLEYIAIAEHSQHLRIAGGLDPSHLLAQMKEIDRLNEKLDGFTILKSIEVDILIDGRLDLPDDVLGKLDLVVGAIHSSFSLSEEKQTARILRAMDQRFFSILAHPSGRLINERQAYRVDMEKIIRNAARRGCFLELNANPKRLDLTDVYCQLAIDQGVLIAINSDAHSESDFNHLRYGVGQARRGWLERDGVLNTRPLSELRKLLKQTMG